MSVAVAEERIFKKEFGVNRYLKRMRRQDLVRMLLSPKQASF